MIIASTPRLMIRRLAVEDAPFILELLNDPSFLRFIGDRGVRTDDDARAYLAAGPLQSYADHGFGLCLVMLADSGTRIGICGLLRRAELDDADLGFALLPQFRGTGYAREAASAVLEHARTQLALQRVAAIVQPDNAVSVRMLESLGFVFERYVERSLAGGLLMLFRLTLG